MPKTPAEETFSLCCVVDKDPANFEVAVGDAKIGNLKKIIQRERALSTLKGVDPHCLELWKVNINLETLEGLPKLQENDEKLALATWKPISFYWPDQPLEDHIHVFVKIRPTVSLLESDPSLRLSETWAPRRNTVRIIHEALNSQRLVQVRGTPGSGKTTLMKLLRNYIFEVDPTAQIRLLSYWPESDGLPLDTRLGPLLGVPNDSPEIVARTYILIDNAHNTYWDAELWEVFFKHHQQLSDGYRIILFCSYGSPSMRIVNYGCGAPTIVWPRISLCPSGIFPEKVGLLLSREEFDDAVGRSKIKMDHALLDFFFDSTAGHVGAFISMLKVFSLKFAKEQRSGITLNIENFKAMDKSEFWQDLSKRFSFRRGLPVDDELSAVRVANVFQELLIKKYIPRTTADSDTVIRCHEHGWIHAIQDEDKAEFYTLPSPLHRAYLSWKLMPAWREIQHETVLELATAVISEFIPSQLSLPPRRLGCSDTDRPLEARYYHEFYRVLVKLVGGTFISPEYGGRVDFFINSKKWGIELLRDGGVPGSRSEADGAADGVWLPTGDMVDYLILDFRNAYPTIGHANPKLYHVVFGEDYHEFKVLDNNLRLKHASRLVEK